MKFSVTMKDPDTLHDAITDAVDADVGKLGLSEEEAERVCELRRDKIQEVCSQWFEYGEYLTVEIDTDSVTAIVVPRKHS